MSKVDILVVDGPITAEIQRELARFFSIHLINSKRPPPLDMAHRIRGLARSDGYPVDERFISAFPGMEIISNLGAGYDGVDLAAVRRRGIVVTSGSHVLAEEVADTAVALLMMTVRELPAAERYLRAGQWPLGKFPLSSASLRDRTVGIAGLGHIGIAIARRLEAANVPVVYHNRRMRRDVAYPYYPTLLAMAEAVDTMMVVLPGGPDTAKLVNADVLHALGERGIIVNVGRGSVVDEPALISALRNKQILAAGLDVFATEPNVSGELLTLPNTVLLPHVAATSVYTRRLMGRQLVDNLVTWFESKRPLTPIVETPWPQSLPSGP